ncbi:MAG: glycosyltransferase family 2 protein [Candidatus Omnitrophica bacterium]|nr:glycosyltransferase family 2 protein [Candidatus Omnitrophota bacterium]
MIVREKNNSGIRPVKRKRGVEDRLISMRDSLYYGFAEPIRLRIDRIRYGNLYASIKEDPLISVYVPTYNRGSLLMERAVSSVLSQTYKNFEFIIVGDCCTDNTEELVSRINDPRIRFYNLSRRRYRYPPTAENHWLAGPVVPANKALESVRGRWIARIDDDDTWTADHLDALLRFAREGDYEFVSAAYVEERRGNRMVNNAANENPRIGGTQTWLYRSYLRFFRYNINCWRKNWNRVNDTDLQDRMFRAGVRMGFLDKVVAYVLPRPGEATIGLEAYKLTEEDKLAHFKF